MNRGAYFGEVDIFGQGITGEGEEKRVSALAGFEDVSEVSMCCTRLAAVPGMSIPLTTPVAFLRSFVASVETYLIPHRVEVFRRALLVFQWMCRWT